MLKEQQEAWGLKYNNMGKVRVTTLGDETLEAKEKAEKDLKRAQKEAREASVEQNSENNHSDETAVAETNSEETKTAQNTESSLGEKKVKKEKFQNKSSKRSSNYLTKAMLVDKNKTYSLTEGLELLRKVKIAKFDETVELHINTTDTGISGTMVLPHGTGKEIRVALVSDEILAEIEKGKINFDILIATPSQMPKLAKVARVLGPRGLMPNPKNGTISENAEEAAKKFQGGQMSFKTESKNPIIHLAVGKTSFEDKQLSENIKTVIQNVKKEKIRKVTLKSTMSPGIRISV